MDSAPPRSRFLLPIALLAWCCRAVAPDERLDEPCQEARCSETGEADTGGVDDCVPTVEVPYDGVDQDCDGQDLRDVDGDGFESTSAEGDDCDDTDASINPAASEICNERDDDCDGLVDGEDEPVDGASTWYADADGDSFGNAEAAVSTCSEPAGHVADATDCDDTDPSVHHCRCLIAARSPDRWALDVARDADVWLEADFDAATVHEDSFLVYGDVSGFLRGTVTVASGAATFAADVSAHPGERLTAVLTDAVHCANGDPAGPLVWTWTAAVDGGSGVLESAGEIATGLDYSYGITAHDFDGDGDLEVATADAQGNTVSIFDGPPEALALVQSITIENYPNYLQGADVDRDGDIDLVVSALWELQVLLNDGTGSFADPLVFAAAGHIFFTGVRAAELDGDGDLDVLLSGSEGGDSLVVMLNDGLGGFAVADEVPYSSIFGNPYPFDVGDIDNDDDLDVLLPLEYEARVSVVLNDGAADFAEVASVTVRNQPKTVVMNDLDGDGDADAAVPTLSGDVYTLEGDGAGGFTTSSLPLTYVHGACGGDLDADGDIDVAVPTFYQFTVQSLLNDGSGAFHVEQTFTTSRPGTSVFCADLDGNGAVDVLLASGLTGDSSVTAYLNTP